MECSEVFYKEWVETEFNERRQNPEDVKKMMDILKRVQMPDLEFDDDAAEDIEEVDEGENFDDAIDSDDEVDVSWKINVTLAIIFFCLGKL